MTDIAATLTALGTLVAAVGAVLIGLRNSSKADAAREKAATAAVAAAAAKEAAAESKREIIAVGDKLYLLDKRVDGRLTELLEQARREGIANADLARFEGHQAGEQAQRDRNAEAQP